jgi:hypothetical protein
MTTIGYGNLIDRDSVTLSATKAIRLPWIRRTAPSRGRTITLVTSSGSMAVTRN